MRGVFRFERIDDRLEIMPLCSRRALDAAGRKLSLDAWKGMTLEERRLVVALGAAAEVDAELVRGAVAGARPEAKAMAPADERDLDALPPMVASQDVSLERWLALGRLERFALRHLAGRGREQALGEALDEILGAREPSPSEQGGERADGLTHLSPRGEARMVDVGDKPITSRRAVARARVTMRPQTARLVLDAAGPKGDVLAAARIAGILAAKKTPELIPLCHGVAVTKVAVALEVDAERGAIDIEATVDARDRTGVEMEAMTAASVAALTVYDMLKAVERGITIERVALVEKSGGKSGHYRRAEP